MHSNVLESKIQLFSNHTGKNNNFSNIISQVPDRHRHHHGEPIIPGPCLLPSQNNDIESPTDSTTSTLTEQQAHVRVSGTDIRPKEIILVSLALLLLIFSVALFFKHWRKNYWDINQLPYYAYLYKTDDSLLLPPPPAVQATLESTAVIHHATNEFNDGGLSPSHSFFGHGQGGSCHSSLRLEKNGFSRESRSSLRLDSKPSSFVCRRHSSSGRRAPKRSSFVHVTAEAMQKLSLNRMNSVSITGVHQHSSHRRHQTFHSPPWDIMNRVEPKLRRCQSGVDRRSRLHGAAGQVGLTGAPRWTTTRRRYRKSSLNDMSDFESTDTGDDVGHCSIALRDFRRRAVSNDNEAVAERDEEETTANDGLLKIVFASPPHHQQHKRQNRQSATSPIIQNVAAVSVEDHLSSSSVHSSPDTRPHFLRVHEAII